MWAVETFNIRFSQYVHITSIKTASEPWWGFKSIPFFRFTHFIQHDLELLYPCSLILNRNNSVCCNCSFYYLLNCFMLLGKDNSCYLVLCSGPRQTQILYWSRSMMTELELNLYLIFQSLIQVLNTYFPTTVTPFHKQVMGIAIDIITFARNYIFLWNWK